jgi:hypothetical protein
MSYTLVVQPEAEADAASISDELEEITPGLGDRFFDALDDLYDRVVYLVEGEAIYVYQVRHTRRNVDPEFGP